MNYNFFVFLTKKSITFSENHRLNNILSTMGRFKGITKHRKGRTPKKTSKGKVSRARKKKNINQTSNFTSTDDKKEITVIAAVRERENLGMCSACLTEDPRNSSINNEAFNIACNEDIPKHDEKGTRNTRNGDSLTLVGSREDSFDEIQDDNNSNSNIINGSENCVTPKKVSSSSPTTESIHDNPIPLCNDDSEIDVTPNSTVSPNTVFHNQVSANNNKEGIELSPCNRKNILPPTKKLINRLPKSNGTRTSNNLNRVSENTSTSIHVSNVIYCGTQSTHGVDSFSNNSSVSGANSIAISNNVNCGNQTVFRNDDDHTSLTHPSHCNISITNNINLSDDSSDSNDEQNVSHNDIPPSNNSLFTSYSTRRRYIRNLKKYIFSLGTLNVQASILIDLLNDTEMKPVLSAAGIKSPKENRFNEHIVNQVLKQINRSSTKSSSKGRVNDDKQSFKINMTAAMMRSPNTNVNNVLTDKKYVNMLCSKTSMSRSSARRLVMKASTRRCILTNSEKHTTWSIISHRSRYNTQQNSINLKILEWILNHPHVISSPIPRDTVLVKVPQSNGQIIKERVGKLLLEISVRELHHDLMKPPPVGLAEVYCQSTNQCIISERHLRNILPPQLRPITFAQKQLCGCECCTVMRMLHTSLIKYRKKIIQSSTSHNKIATRSQNSISKSFDEYIISLKGNHLFTSNHPRDMINHMSCTVSDDDIMINWKCAMGRCIHCPQPEVPHMESLENSSLTNILYATYKYHSRCKLHGLVASGMMSCTKCTEAIERNELNAPEKITKRKEITSVETSIHKFHNDVYIPMLKRYRYHIALVNILSKHHCKKMRFETFCKRNNWMFSERDYAERLVKQLDGEIQSDHFGDNATLSIEGCTLQYHKPISPDDGEEKDSIIAFDFHSHFADFSKQDAATTFEHMCSMFSTHESVNGKIAKNTVLLDHTDGCAKQYRSGNAFYLLNIMSLKYDIVIDRCVGAPGHGKSIIDGLNAVDKHFLKKVMCMSGSTRADDIQTRMNMYAIAKESNLSFATECARLCGSDNRKSGVLSSSAYNNRKQKLNARYYHVQDCNKVRYHNISKVTKGWIKDTFKGNGVQHHYNFRADPVLGLGYIAVRRIPCMCDSCAQQLDKSWLPNKSFTEQPRYMSDNVHCKLWNVLGPLNNWRLISIVDNDPQYIKSTSIITQNIFRETLHERASAMMSLIEEGNYGAIATTDNAALSGYYVFCFKSCGYILQNSIETNSGKIPAGEFVCDVTWLNSVPNTTRFYSHGFKDDDSLDTIVRIQHIVEENVCFEYLNEKEMLPKSIRYMFDVLKSKNTIVVSNECHDQIIETILARNHLDYDEYLSMTEDNDSSDIDSSDDEN